MFGVELMNDMKDAATNLRFGMMSVKHPLEAAFGAASRAGLRHMEVDLIQPHNSLESFTSDRIKRLKTLSRQYGVSLSLHTPYTINPADEVGFFRKANEEYLKRLISLACRLKCTHITTHIGFWVGLTSWGWKRKTALETLIRTLKNLLPSLRKHRIPLALENVNPMPRDSEFQLLGDNIKDFQQIYSEVGSPFMRMCLDVGHAHTDQGPLKYMQDFGAKIIAVHFHDNHGKYDEHLAVRAGNINWKKVAAGFQGMGFSGPFISEVFTRTPKQAKEDLLSFFRTAGCKPGKSKHSP